MKNSQIVLNQNSYSSALFLSSLICNSKKGKAVLLTVLV